MSGIGAAPIATPDESKPSPDVLKEVLKAYLEVYRNHFDLFVKGAAGFLVSVGFVAGFLFGSSADKQIKAALATAVCGGSIAIVGGLISLLWVLRLEREVHQISTAFGVGRFPFIGAKGMTLLLVALALMFLCLACSIRALYIG